MSNRKIWLAFMAGKNSLEDLKELVEPVIHAFDGLVVTYHGHEDDASPEIGFLEENKKDGKIIYADFTGRHDHSRNKYLFDGPIKQNDIIVTLDTLERIAPEFLQNLPLLIQAMDGNNIDVVRFYVKPYVIRFREDMYYHGTPHESFISDFKMNQVDLMHSCPDESKVRINMRPIKRKDKFHWVNHYAKYYFYPNSNQCLLGMEHRPNDSFERRQRLREEVRQYMLSKGLDFTLFNFEMMYKHNHKDQDIEIKKRFLNKEKILQDFIRYYIWKDETVIDEHKWETMKKYE